MSMELVLNYSRCLPSTVLYSTKNMFLPIYRDLVACARVGLLTPGARLAQSLSLSEPRSRPGTPAFGRAIDEAMLDFTVPTDVILQTVHAHRSTVLKGAVTALAW